MKYLYTVITGDKDILNDDINVEGVKAVCFTDKNITSKVWEIRRIPLLFKDIRRDSRMPKMLPHIYFPDATHSLYVDGNIITTIPLQKLIDEWLNETDIAFFKHGVRDCYFEEAKECIRLGLDGMEVIADQMVRYKDFPRHRGLYQGGVILRKHTERINRFNETWFAEYCTGSRRDQISLPIALSRAGVAAKAIDGHAYYHPYFTMSNHNVPSEWAGKI